MLKDLIVKNRSYRRFYQDRPIERKTLEELVDLARLSASGGNLQPLKYILSTDKEMNERIYPYLMWAGYLKDWDGPQNGERPVAYVIICEDKRIMHAAGVDHGIAAQSIMLGAVEKGLGGCMISSIKREGLQKELAIPENLKILLVLALGVPKEQVVIEDTAEPEGNIKYWRDEQQVHHVPKRSLSEIILW